MITKNREKSNIVSIMISDSNGLPLERLSILAVLSVSIVILFLFIFEPSTFNIISFTIILITTTQVLFLINGVNFARMWEVTEYKELLIPLALFIYSLDVFASINRIYFQGT